MRRERWDIVGAILASIEDQRALCGEAIHLTAVATQANVPYDRLVSYLSDLRAAGLIVGAKTPALTPDGKDFLRHYLAWREVLARHEAAVRPRSPRR